MRTVGQVLLVALYALMLVAAGVLVFFGVVALDTSGSDPEFGGAAAAAGLISLVVGAILAWGSVFLLRRRWRADRQTPNDEVGVVRGPSVETETPELWVPPDLRR